MNRPLYQNSRHTANQNRLKDLIESHLTHKRIKFEELPIKDSADFCACRDSRVVAFVEMKNRSNTMNKYPTFMISLFKINHILSYCERSSLPLIVFIEWTDCIGYIEVKSEHLKDIRWQGKDYRNDPQDKEPCVHIPIEQFKIFKPQVTNEQTNHNQSLF